MTNVPAISIASEHRYRISSYLQQLVWIAATWRYIFWIPENRLDFFVSSDILARSPCSVCTKAKNGLWHT